MRDGPAPAGWRQPEPWITALLDAPPTPWLVLAPDAAHLLEVGLTGLPALSDVARPKTKLAGLRLDAARSARHQLVFGTSLALRDLRGTLRRELPLPPGRRIASLSWSHDARHFALVLDAGGPGELWWGALDRAELSLATPGLHAVLTDGFTWLPDGARVLVTLVPERRGPPPTRPAVATGPVVLETRAETTPQRTHQDLLQDEHDEALFDYLAASELALVDLEAARVERLEGPAPIAGAEPSPDGRWALVQVLEKPWSRTHTLAGFGHGTFARELHGARRVLVARQPVAANVPIEGVRTGPRAVQWSAHGGARVVYVEALDGGDPRAPAEHRDRWLELDEPFAGPAREVARLEQRASAIAWLADPTRLLLREWDRDRRWTRLWNAAVGADRSRWTLLDDRSANDRYADPGSILFEPRARGRRIVRQRGPWFFRIGSGEEQGGARPFLDRERLDEPGARERLFQCASGEHERPLALVEDELGVVTSFVTRHESPRDPPNLRLRPLGAEVGAFERLTDFHDPAPIFRRVRKELVRYPRADGVQLSGTLHLPPDWDGRRLPLVVWAYPREFVDADTASQVRGTPFDFTRVAGPSPLYFVLRGYAVLEGAEMPVVGHPETMNDRFLEQIGASAQAAIEHLDARGVCDPARVGIGGHSYGAFMAVALLATTGLFKAGIARSGAYNRTLTPFGFQSERRTLWEAPASYLKLSPLLDAHRIRAPLLLVHGAEDENSGTHPEQSARLFQAIRGTGGTARHVVLPHEGHGYRSREAVLHVLAEMFEWFDEHVRG
ncbi:MAG: S9 family peptidase [Planctomycetes bacterium]|nr:S9 family peptidase [Planctomycetota bacterium]